MLEGLSARWKDLGWGGVMGLLRTGDDGEVDFYRRPDNDRSNVPWHLGG